MNSTRAVRFQRVYVWELPVRVYHWVNAACIAALVGTGYLIGHPVTLGLSNEAYQQYWFGTVRFIHFTAAFVFFFNTVIRLYWAFAGNSFARWRQFLPTTRERWGEVVKVIASDVIQIREAGRISLGHNALAGVSYFLFFLAFLFQSFTGFALYSSMSEAMLPGLFAWVVPLMGGDMAVRQWHHLMIWLFVAFTMVHVYLVFYHDYVEGRGTASSIVGGWKFEREEYLREGADPDPGDRERADG